MTVIKLIEYNTWANRLVMNQIKSMPDELFDKQFQSSFPSIRATVTHLIESDWLWLNRFKGIPLADVPTIPSDVQQLTERWLAIQDEMNVVAKSFTAKEETPIKFITRKGAPYTMSFADVATHVSHHGSYHRGQITSMIRSTGHQPVSTDYFIFCST